METEKLAEVAYRAAPHATLRPSTQWTQQDWERIAIAVSNAANESLRAELSLYKDRVRADGEHMEELRAKLAEREVDAERYRYLRIPGNAIVYAARPDAWQGCAHPAAGHVRYKTSDELDAAIDSARKENKT